MNSLTDNNSPLKEISYADRLLFDAIETIDTFDCKEPYTHGNVVKLWLAAKLILHELEMQVENQ